MQLPGWVQKSACPGFTPKRIPHAGCPIIGVFGEGKIILPFLPI
jgi:hypothetical protein